MAESQSICPIEGCGARKDVEHLFCLRHWRMVTKTAQSRVWDTWRDVRRRESGAIENYREAVAEATRQVAARETQGRLI